jgi:hypothetical protein
MCMSSDCVRMQAVIGAGARVGPYAKIALEPEEENDEVEFEEAALGPSGAGVRMVESDPLNQLRTRSPVCRLVERACACARVDAQRVIESFDNSGGRRGARRQRHELRVR